MNARGFEVRVSVVRAFGGDKPADSVRVIPAVEGFRGVADEVTLRPGEWLEMVEAGEPDRWATMRRRETVKPFCVELNLDDEEECREFVAKWGVDPIGFDRLVGIGGKLGLVGEGAAPLVSSLIAYAGQRLTAFNLRRAGAIEEAMAWEKACDRIYAQEIAPVCECW